ncbi:hypothetical protein GQX74_014498 [Glossina fuscipes]|nr:hypothetical protein GQX74_014498 [Glossina fuscipes]
MEAAFQGTSHKFQLTFRTPANSRRFFAPSAKECMKRTCNYGTIYAEKQVDKALPELGYLDGEHIMQDKCSH